MSFSDATTTFTWDDQVTHKQQFDEFMARLEASLGEHAWTLAETDFNLMRPLEPILHPNANAAETIAHNRAVTDFKNAMVKFYQAFYGAKAKLLQQFTYGCQAYRDIIN